MAELTAAQVEAELATLRLEKERLELQVLRETVAAQNAKRLQMIQAIKRQADTIKKNERRRIQQQSTCKHLKGGRGREGILSGNAAEASIIVQTEPWGETYMLYQRRQKEWRKPLAVIQMVNPVEFKAIVKKDKKAYIAALEEFNKAMRTVTDNSPSGSTIFEFRQGFDDAA